MFMLTVARFIENHKLENHAQANNSLFSRHKTREFVKFLILNFIYKNRNGSTWNLLVSLKLLLKNFTQILFIYLIKKKK